MQKPKQNVSNICCYQFYSKIEIFHENPIPLMPNEKIRRIRTSDIHEKFFDYQNNCILQIHSLDFKHM